MIQVWVKVGQHSDWDLYATFPTLSAAYAFIRRFPGDVYDYALWDTRLGDFKGRNRAPKLFK